MIALDTNVLVRLLTRDDEKQAQKVRVLFDSHAGNNDEFFVSDVVLAELAWTLERTYGFDRTAISKTFRALVENASLGFQSRDVVRLAQSVFESTKIGFADSLIIAQSQAQGCTSLVTFDKAMRSVLNVDLL
jgi:predicted nucleic-acid-binding protein